MTISNSTVQALKSLEATLQELGNNEQGETVYHLNHTEQEMKKFCDYLVSKGAMTASLAAHCNRYARYHDIGKAMVNQEILYSNERYDRNSPEMKHIQQHTEFGALILKKAFGTTTFDGKDVLEDIVTKHHERHDGNGYPYGLKGNPNITPSLSVEEFLTEMKKCPISLASAVMHLVDVYCALAEVRTYKKSKPFDVIIDILEKSNQDDKADFNPWLHRQFINMLHANHEEESKKTVK